VISVLNASVNKFFYEYAESYVTPYERNCCALMQRILNRDQSVYVLADADDAPAVIHGVIAYNKGGSFFHCLPEQDEQVSKAIATFLRTNKLFCITGECSGTQFVQSIVQQIDGSKPFEQRDYYLMEHTDNSAYKSEGTLKIICCRQKNINEVAPLQYMFVEEEVLPKGTVINKSAELILLQKMIAAKKVFAGIAEKKFVAKIHINAESKRFMQLGGVYTGKEFRGRGFACQLVTYVTNLVRGKKKQPILFVNEKNNIAYGVYKRVGFTKCGSYRIVYYV